MAGIEYSTVDPLKQKRLLRQCVLLARQRLGQCQGSRVLRTLRLYTQRLLVVAHLDGEVLGFKLGFAERDGIFYSWLGAVREDCEGQGIGRRLQEVQHEFLRAAHYRKVRTRTRNRFQRMLMLNLRSGFEIVGMSSKGKEPLLLLEKRLIPGS